MKLQLSSGKKLMGWLLVRKLGEGAFGQVWYAQADGGFGETALKFIDATGENREKAKREYATLKMMCENRAFQSSRLIKLQGVWLLDEDEKPIPDAKFGETVFGQTLMMDEVGPQPDALMIQMDLAQSSLAELLDITVNQAKASELGGLPIDELLPFMYQAAKGIDFLNQKPRIFHCDIKPENLLLVDGEVKICDYGGARKEGLDRKHKKNVLSIAHASPELMNNAPCEFSDQYSLAITYVQLRTGRLPYSDTVLRSRSVSTVRDAVLRGDLDLSGLPPAERAVIKRATSLKPEKRFPTATAMAVELDRAIHHGGGGGWKRLVIGGIAAAALAAAVLIARPWNWIPSPRPITKDDPPRNGNGGDHKDDPVTVDQTRIVQDLTATIDDVMKRLDQSALPPSEVEAQQRALESFNARLAAVADADLQARLSQRNELALARLRLQSAWPDAQQPPMAALDLSTDESSALWKAEQPEQLPGLKPAEWRALLALRALRRWPGRDEPLATEDLAGVAQSLAAIPLGHEELAPLEGARCDVLKEKLGDAVKTLTDSASGPLPEGLDVPLKQLFGDNYLIGIARNNVLMAAVNEAAASGEFKEAKARANQLAALAAGNAELAEMNEWYQSLANLGDADPAASLRKLASKPGDPEQQNALAKVLQARFANSAAGALALPTLDAVIELAEGLTSATDPPSAQLQVRLLARRLAARAKLPAAPGNGWVEWTKDIGAITALLEDQGAKTATAANPLIDLPLVTLGQIEVGAAEAIGKASTDAQRWRGALQSLLSDARAVELLNATQFPGYVDYVTGLVESLDGKSAAAATKMLEVYSAANGAATASSPALVWPERRAKAADILVHAVRELRNEPFDDLTMAPFSPENAAQAVTLSDLAVSLSGGASTAPDSAMLALAQSSVAETSPRDMIAVIDPLVNDDVPPDSAAQAHLLLASARAHGALAHENPDEARLAATRFARALTWYQAWASAQTPDVAREERLEQRVLKPARDALRPYLNVDAGRIDASIRPAVAQLAATIGRVNVALSRAGALPPDSEMTPRVIANWLKLANDAAGEPSLELLKLEGAWLRDMLVRGEGSGAVSRLVELKRLVTGDDPASLALRGIATFYEYRQQNDWVAKKEKLDESLALFDQAIGGASSVMEDTARYFLDRGGVNLQLAYVVYKGRGDLGNTTKPIKEYLEDAINDARIVADSPLPPRLQVEAYNLLGNASEDMFFYGADVEGDRIDFHYRNAEEAFNNAYRLLGGSPDAAFNLARCTFRYGRAQRFHFGEQKFDNAKYQQSLRDANESINSALNAWGTAKNEMKAEALYWQGEIQEELGNFGAAEEKFGEAAALARELGDTRWATFQLMWAQLALNRRDADTTAERLQPLLDASTPAANSAERRTGVVDQQALAEAVYLLIRSQTSPAKSRELLDAYLSRFDGDSSTDLACQARLRLAYANSLLGAPDRAADVEAEANRVLELTAPPLRGSSWDVFRSQSHFLLGRVAFQQIDPRNRQKTLDAARRAASSFASGMEQVAASRELSAQENWIANARQFVDAAVKVFEFDSNQTQRAAYAQKVHDCIDEFNRRMDDALPGRKLNGRLPREWKLDVTNYRRSLLDRGFPPSKTQ